MFMIRNVIPHQSSCDDIHFACIESFSINTPGRWRVELWLFAILSASITIFYGNFDPLSTLEELIRVIY